MDFFVIINAVNTLKFGIDHTETDVIPTKPNRTQSKT